MQYVYFVSDGEFTKIGMSANPIARLSDMQTYSPRRLSISAAFEVDSLFATAAKVEKELHRRFSDSRIGGEWFRLVDIDFEVVFCEALKCVAANSVKIRADGKPRRRNRPPKKEKTEIQNGRFNKVAYMQSYMADLRAAKKIGITIREYRERKRDELPS